MKKGLSFFLSLLLALNVITLGISSLQISAVEENISDINTGWYWPLSQSYTSISSGFGYRASMGDYHQGIDIQKCGGQPIYAARKGTVVYVNWLKTGGNTVSIRHGTYNGSTIYTTYMHMRDKGCVSVGQEVDQTTVIGYVGNTGGGDCNPPTTYGVHLHFQICKNSMNPAHNNNSDLNNNYFNPTKMSYSYDHTTPSYYNPQGDVNDVNGGEGGVYVRGWAFDYDMPSDSVEIHVYIGGPAGTGEGHNGIYANMYREDVNYTYSVSGNHGFEAFINTSLRGSQSVYIYAINVGGGYNVQIGSGTVTITDPQPTGYNPVGDLNHIIGGTCSINIRGWAFDQDVLSSPVEVDIFIGGDYGAGEGHAILANTYRPDVHNAYGVGEYHGFDATITTTKTGHQLVYVYILNYGNGSTVLLWSGYVDIEADTTAPVITRAYVTNQGYGGYTVVCEFEDNVGVTYVEFPTWTTANGQDDLIFYPGTIQQNESYAYALIGRVSHGYEYGEYITDVYVYDAAGNFSIKTVRVNVENNKPVISNARVTNITPNGYTVSCDIEDDSEITSITFPTWTANTGHNATDQDDIECPNVKFDGKTASIDVKVSNHNNETGRYKTHIYVYDIWENCNTFLFENIYVPSENELYTITYDPNRGINPPASHSDYVQVTLSETVPTRNGYTFLGWSTSESATEAQYQPSETISPGQSITLYAVWEKAFVLGDADGDGEIGLKDVVQITRYLAGGWDVIVDLAAADINKDGEVNLKDAVILRRYLTGGWGIQLA